MGISTAGVFIKLDSTEHYDLDKIMIDFFGYYMKKEDDWKSGFDIRKSEYKMISRFDNGILINVAELVDNILVKRKTKVIKLIYEYFSKPLEIFTYMNYGSGGSIGYAYIKDGYIARRNFNLSNQIHTQEGTPFPEEVAIMNSRYYLLGEGEDTFLHYDNDDYSIKEDYYYSICEYTTPKIMNQIIGFEYYNEIKSKESAYYYYAKEVDTPKKSWFTKIFK